MKYFILAFTILFIFSCRNKKILQLPEVSKSEITDIKDLSHAYLFYDETQTDSVELNRKNLISTTNWLINVDKRLTLKQAIPHIKYLQSKKANSSHKNKNAKNYFTCNDTLINNLGFMEFTNISYHIEDEPDYFKHNKKQQLIGTIYVNTLNDIHLSLIEEGHSQIEAPFGISNLNKKLKELNSEFELPVFINFNSNISFQDYITVKSHLSKLNWKYITISKNEFISN